jgi:DNA helicase-2/ATP-dependent DNA helicase PcrA
MWQQDRSPQAHSRLENLKELIRLMHEFETLPAFLEHVSLVMDADEANGGERVSLMTLHAAKGLEFDTVFLPGWEEGLFPHQRSLDEEGLAGLEEERRLAYVGLTRARRAAHISFTQNRRTRGLWQTAAPSRFVEELPEAHIDLVQTRSPFGGVYGGLGRSNPFGSSRFDEPGARFASPYSTPGWQRAQARGRAEEQPARAPLTIEGELVASSTAQPSGYALGDRIFHQKFGYGRVAEIDGNKLTIEFDKAGRKRVVDSFVERA